MKMDQIERFSKDVKERGLKIGLFYSEECDKAKTKRIASEMVLHLKCEAFAVKVVKMSKKGLKKATFGKVTHSVIVGDQSRLSAKQSLSHDIFDLTKRDGKSISEVIFVQNSSEIFSHDFLSLDSNLHSVDLSIRILTHFAGKSFNIIMLLYHV